MYIYALSCLFLVYFRLVLFIYIALLLFVLKIQVCLFCFINGAPGGLGDLGRRAIYFQGAGEHC